MSDGREGRDDGTQSTKEKNFMYMGKILFEMNVGKFVI